MKTKLKISGEIFTGIIKYVGNNYKLVEVEGIDGNFEIAIKTRGLKNVPKDDYYGFLYKMKTNSNFVSIDCHNLKRFQFQGYILSLTEKEMILSEFDDNLNHLGYVRIKTEAVTSCIYDSESIAQLILSSQNRNDESQKIDLSLEKIYNEKSLSGFSYIKDSDGFLGAYVIYYEKDWVLLWLVDTKGRFDGYMMTARKNLYAIQSGIYFDNLAKALEMKGIISHDKIDLQTSLRQVMFEITLNTSKVIVQTKREKLSGQMKNISNNGFDLYDFSDRKIAHLKLSQINFIVYE